MTFVAVKDNDEAARLKTWVRVQTKEVDLMGVEQDSIDGIHFVRSNFIFNSYLK